MENRALLAVVISLLILLAYQAFVLPFFYPSAPDVGEQAFQPAAEAERDAPPMPLPQEPLAKDEVASPRQPAPPSIPERIVTVETDHAIAVLTSRGGRIKSLQEKAHRTTVDPDSSFQELILPAADHELPLGVEMRGRQASPGSTDAESNVLSVSDSDASYSIDGPATMRLRGSETGRVELTWNGPAGVVRKVFDFVGDQYPFTVSVGVGDAPPAYSELGITWVVPRDGKAEGTTEVLYDRIVYLKGREFVSEMFEGDSLLEGQLIQADTQDPLDLQWVGVAGRHFLAALVPAEANAPRLWLKERSRVVQAKLLYPIQGQAAERKITVFVGAKDVEAMEATGHHLERAIDLGYFSFIGFPLLWALRLSHTLTHNYGLDIILLTVVIKILFLPLTQKSFQTMKAMQKLQPQMAKLREQYKDEQETLNKEMIELYRRHKVNPFGGCVPMLLQFPVFIGLYQALMNAVELRHSPFFLWIDDLSAPDRLGSLQLPFVDQAGIPILTVLMGASMLAQQWMSPAVGDPAQQRIMMLMPLLFTFVFVNFPSGLVLYWLVNNVLTIAQQYYINRPTTAAA